MPTAAQAEAEAETWLDQYLLAAASIQAGNAAWSAFEQIGDWYNPVETIGAAKDAAATISAMLQTVDAMAAQYASLVAAALTDSTPRILSSPSGEYVRNADPFDVYSRPIWTYKDTIARGGTESEAFIAARERASLLAEHDTALAERNATQAEAEAQGAKRYRRVLRPELSASGVCGLCIVAAERVYKIKELMPLHDRCKCKTMMILNGRDPAERINVGDLKVFYADAGSSKAADLKRTRYRVDDHKELGPTLVYQSDKRIDLAAKPDDRERASRELAALLPVLESLESRASAGEKVPGPLAYQRQRIAYLRRLLAA